MVIDAESHALLMARDDQEITIDLEAQEVRFGNHVAGFTVEPFARQCLLEGADTLGWLLNRNTAIEAYEREHAA